MKKIVNLILSIFLLNIFMLGAFADSKYFNYKIKIHLIERRLQVNPAYIKLRFTTTDGKITEEIDCIGE